MKYKIYQMKFSTAVHFGNGRLSSTEKTFCADTLFSALCIECKKMNGTEGIDKLVKYARENKLRFSDGMPFVDGTYFVPKPVLHIESRKNGDSEAKKKFKKLSYIPADALESFVSGSFDPQGSIDLLKLLGCETLKTSAAIFENDDAKPYSIGTYEYGHIEKNSEKTKHDSGLYFIIGFEDDEVYDFVDWILCSLQYSGIGGKKSGGLGKFITVMQDVPGDILKRLTDKYERYMSISVCMASDDELDSVIDGSYYTLKKRSGFIQSYDYADNFVKKSDFYCFSAGSCFSGRFDGDVFDVGGNGTHPVYRYAKPLLLGVI